jgi:hypothetical protein
LVTMTSLDTFPQGSACVDDLTNSDSRECFPKPRIASKNGKLIVTCPFGLVGFSPGPVGS